MKIIGLDISLNHGGVVVLDESGEVESYLFSTTIKKYAKVDFDHCLLLQQQGKEESKDSYHLRKIGSYLTVLNIYTSAFDLRKTYISIEGYSYGSLSTAICQIAELTGCIKRELFEKGCKIRVHDPLSVKLFATGKGICLKKDIVKQAKKHFTFPDGLIKEEKKKTKYGAILEYGGPGTDLADAYFLARMLYVELMIRKGILKLDQLSEGERRIFLRTTKMYPVNILDRPFISGLQD